MTTDRASETGSRTSGSTKPGDENPEPGLGLFEGFGVEIEYMIVDRETLDVRPVADRLMEAVAGVPTAEVELGEIEWSNELVLHVLEMKTNGPVSTLEGLAARFDDGIRRADELLQTIDCTLLPGGVHPWMHPGTETRLWPHEYTEVYRTFDRIFSCRGHGWANLQSTHLNLPFQGDREFAALHASVRGLLPLLPALAASSPIIDGRPTGVLDHRLIEYRSNSKQVPSVAGAVVPEPSSSRAAYEREVLDRIYHDLAPLDPSGALRHEWVNARGAIPRFDRGTIEIRVLDPQECPEADLAVLAATTAAVKVCTYGVLEGNRTLDRVPTRDLAGLLDAVIRDGGMARVENRAYLAALEVPRPGRRIFVAELWETLLGRAADAGIMEADMVGGGELGGPLSVILERGPLARRILNASGNNPDHRSLTSICRELADCLRGGTMFGSG